MNQFHVLAHGAAALDASAGDVQLAAIADPIITRANNNFQIPEDMDILGAYAGGIGSTRFRLNYGSSRSRGFPNIVPWDLTALPIQDPNMMDFRFNPLRLKLQDDYRVDVTNGGANNAHAISLIQRAGQQDYNINYKDIRWLRFTLSVTAVAYGWSTAGSIAFVDTLEPGRWALCGMQIFEATIIAARVLFPQGGFRPGCLGQALGTSRSHEMFRGGLGVWGFFNTYNTFQIEVLANAAAAITPAGWVMVAKADDYA